ncbi:hypothetical protein [Thermoflexus hugenholtzii]
MKKDITRRYADAYAVAQGIIIHGQSLKALGMLIGGGIFFLTLIGMQAVGAQVRAAGEALLAGLILGVGLGMATGGPLYAAGVLIAAQGQLLQAILDTAVHTSPLLSLEQKEELLMPSRTLLPEGPAPAPAAPGEPVQIPCPHCGAPVYVTARMCPSCWQPLRP